MVVEKIYKLDTTHTIQKISKKGMSQFIDNRSRKYSNSFPSLAGLKTVATSEEDDIIGGIREKMQDAGDVINTGVGNSIGKVVETARGVSINTVNTFAPVWQPHGAFSWHVGFNVGGRNISPGWIVQEIENSYNGQTAPGGALITNATAGATPHYYESWQYLPGMGVTPSLGGTNDMFIRPSMLARLGVNNSHGRWSMKGKLYFTTTNPAMPPGGVPDAGALPSAVAAPGNLGIALHHRYAHGTWEPLGPTHLGSNR